MRIVAITSKPGDIVQPTQAAVDSSETLRRAMVGCRHNQAIVTYVYSDNRPCPIVIEFENGEVFPVEQWELEK